MRSYTETYGYCIAPFNAFAYYLSIPLSIDGLMDIKMMIQALLDSGMSQRSLADEVGVTQPTIHRSLNGAEVRYSVGLKIEALYKELVGNKAS